MLSYIVVFAFSYKLLIVALLFVCLQNANKVILNCSPYQQEAYVNIQIIEK